MTRGRSILFVNQHYWPDLAPTGQIVEDLSEYLVSQGFDVTVLCSRGKYVGRGRLEAHPSERRNGVKIVRVRGAGLGRGSTGARLIDYMTFLVRSLGRILRMGRYDLIVFLTTPSLLEVVGGCVRGLRGQPYLVWSMDLHPEIEVQLGILPRWTAPLFQSISRWSHRKATAVVALGECMKARLVEKGVPEKRIHVIPVWGREDQIEPIPKEDNPLVADLGLEGRFVVMYSGNAGLAHRFTEVLGAIERMQASDIEWVFAGEGQRKQEIIERVGDRTNVRYLGYRPHETLKHWLSLADVHLVTMRRDMAGLVVPAKLYGIMAAGRPVVFVGPRGSDTARTIEEEGIGEVVDPSLGEEMTGRLMEILLGFREDPAKGAEMGRRAREGFLARYSRSVACAAWEELIEEAEF